MIKVIDMLKGMSLKEFSIFQHALTSIRQDQVNKYFSELFYKYITTLVKNTDEYPAYKLYFTSSDFDDTSFSKVLSFENNIHSVSITKNEISFSDHLFKTWKLIGTPDDYKVELPHKFSWEIPEADNEQKPFLLKDKNPTEKIKETYDERRKRLDKLSEIPIPNNMEHYAVLFWRCYWMYLDSKPDDDRPLDEDEEQDEEEWAEKFGDNNSKWMQESEEYIADVNKRLDKECADKEASRKIADEIREQKRVDRDNEYKRKLNEQIQSYRTSGRFQESFGADTPNLQTGTKNVLHETKDTVAEITTQIEQANAKRLNLLQDLYSRITELTLKNNVYQAELKLLREKHNETDVESRKNKMKELDTEYLSAIKEYKKQLTTISMIDNYKNDDLKQELKKEFMKKKQTYIAQYKELGITMHLGTSTD